MAIASTINKVVYYLGLVLVLVGSYLGVFFGLALLIVPSYRKKGIAIAISAIIFPLWINPYVVQATGKLGMYDLIDIIVVLLIHYKIK